MPSSPTVHPSADVLQAFGLGKLDDSSAAVLMNHLDQCADCCQVVASQSGDDFLDRLRQVHGRNSTPAPANALSASLGVPKSPVSPPANPTAIPNLAPELAANPQYEVLRELGRGGMGVVYLAKNKLMDRLEVLKVVNKTLLDRPSAVERFLREIRSAAKLSHANVVGAYSAVQVGDLLAFAMEYVEGQDLAAVVKTQGPLSVPYACYYVQQAALGLQHAFEKNMVHRDIKPQNLILAREGNKHIVKVLDFGLAKVMCEKAEDTGLTGDGKMLGTPDYIAPEQTLDAASADIRADIYSLGCTLYFLLSGRPPFSAASLGAVLLAHQTQEAKLLNLVRPEVPEELAAVVRKMMVKERAKRYQTPLQVAQALAGFIKPGAAPKSSPDLSVAAPGASSIQTAKADHSIMPAAEGESRKAPVPEAPTPVAWDLLTERITASPEPRKRGAVRKRRSMAVPPAARKKWWIGGGVAAGLLLGLLAVVMLRIETRNGTLLVEMNEEVEARIKNGKLILSGPDGKPRYTLTPNDRSKKLDAGSYKIHVEGVDGLVLDTTEFTIKKGDEVKVRVMFKRKAVAKKDSPDKSDVPKPVERPVPGKVDPIPPAKQDVAKTLEEHTEEFEYLIEGEKKKGSRRVVVLDIGGGEKLEFVRIPKGEFLMGSLDGEANERPQRRVEISRDFYLGKYEVTQAQYRAVIGQSPSHFKGDRLPVEQVSWVDAVKFCEVVSEWTKRKVNLPTEAEEEYACRAGTKTPFHFGSQLNGDLANCNGTIPHGTNVKGVNKEMTVAVGSYPASPWGLHDMHGNVWEWCQDYYGPYDKLEGRKDPIQLIDPRGMPKSFRGGSWSNPAWLCRAAARSWGSHNIGHPAVGFRACLRLE